MSLQNFMASAKTNLAIQQDLENAGKESLIDVAKEHGFKLSAGDIDNAKNQRSQVSYSCIEMYWTSVCSI